MQTGLKTRLHHDVEPTPRSHAAAMINDRATMQHISICLRPGALLQLFLVAWFSLVSLPLCPPSFSPVSHSLHAPLFHHSVHLFPFVADQLRIIFHPITGARTGKLPLASGYMRARRGVTVPVGPRSHLERAGEIRLPVRVVTPPIITQHRRILCGRWADLLRILSSLRLVSFLRGSGGIGDIVVCAPSLFTVKVLCISNNPGLVSFTGKRKRTTGEVLAFYFDVCGVVLMLIVYTWLWLKSKSSVRRIKPTFLEGALFRNPAGKGGGVGNRAMTSST